MELRPGTTIQLQPGEEMVAIPPPVLYIDGHLANVIEMFELFAAAALELQHPDWPQEKCEEAARVPAAATQQPPHDISKLARACGLNEQEYEEVKRCLSEVEGLWQQLSPLPTAQQWTDEIRKGLPVVARRFPTAHRGRTKIWGDPLVQTLQWIRNHLGVEYPVIVMTPDSWD